MYYVDMTVMKLMIIFRYDRFGEEDEEGNGGGGGHQSQHGKYQSWQYFHDDFGLYDDDPEVVTLSYHDFRRSVDDAYSFWFINFYRQDDINYCTLQYFFSKRMREFRMKCLKSDLLSKPKNSIMGFTLLNLEVWCL